MAIVSMLHLIRPSMGKPLRHNVLLNGAPTGQPGVTAIIVRDRRLGWCLLADHPENPGVSVTNGAEDYAEAVCRALECPRLDLAWYELDSEGKFDELHLQSSTAGFAPVLEEGCPPRSLEAFTARVSRLPGGLPEDAVKAVQACLERFSA
ncbi:hypothetical protein [Burkholderia ubonensis]|nr:hypothetical protein [Burkholderia ubonensis]KVP75338.1 hypothetical protein WJ93_07945 [Burkholderia ubonensis]